MGRSPCGPPHLAALAILGGACLLAAGQNRAEHFGISIGAPVWQGQVTFTEQVANDLNELGVKWIRVEFIAAGDTINYAQYDEIVNRANAHGLQILGLVTYQTKWWVSTSDWANDAWQDSFRDRVVQVVNRYKNWPGGPIRFWEVWNEPDSMGWMPPDKFGRLLSIVYPAIKQADPLATVVSGGLTGYWTPTYTYMNAVYNSSYFQSYKAAHGIYPFDIFGLHPYHWTANPSTYLAQYMNGTYGLRRLLNSKGDGYKRMWFTEYGWNSSPTADSSINPGGNEAANEQLQADYCATAYGITQSLTFPSAPFNKFGPYVEKTFLFCYKDFDLGTPQTREFFGTVRMNFQRKPLFFRYQSLAASARQNAALRAFVSASGQDGPLTGPERACDGTVFTQWKCGTPADAQTLTLTLDDWYTVYEFRLAHAQLNHQPDTYNLAAFVIESSLTGGPPWTAEFTVNNPNREPVNILTLPTPRVLRYIRLRVTDAGLADGTVRLPEFEVWGTPAAPPSGAAVAYQFGASLAALDRAPAAGDLIVGQIAAFEGGHVDPANGVAAFNLAPTACLEVLSTPVTAFWHGYSDPSPAAHLPRFTDGDGLVGVVLRDYARAACVLRYDLPVAADLREVRVFARNPDADNRVLQHYDVFVSTDGGVTYEPLATDVRTGGWGLTNPGTWTVSYTRVYPQLDPLLAEDVTNIRFVFYAVTAGGPLVDPWQGNANESATYRGSCPAVEPADADGLRKAYVTPIITEIDVLAREPGDTDVDGDVDLADFAVLAACLNGPDVLHSGGVCRGVDFAPRDEDVDLADVAAFQRAFGR